MRAANKHGVPKSTLHDRISGKVEHGDKPAPKLLLTSTEENEFADILEEASDVPVASPVMIDDSELIENVSDKTENEVQNGPTATDDTRCPCSSGCNDSQVSALMLNKEVGTSSQKSSDNDAQGNASSSSSNPTTATSSKVNGDKLRYISKYLVRFVPDACPQNKETAVRISGARVLTSDKCVAILKEREDKQKQQ